MNFRKGELPFFHKLAITENIQEKFDTTIEKIINDSSVVQKKTIKKYIAEKSNEEKAKESSEMITKLRKERLAIITGESDIPYSEGAIKKMVEEINKQEQEYIELFTGYTITSKEKFKFTFIPDSNNIRNENLIFRFNEDKGIVSKEDTSGKEIILKIEKSNSLLNKVISNQYSNIKKNGFPYIVPDLSKITVKFESDILKQTNYLISQFGIVSFLPKKKNNLKVQYFKNTGAIKCLSY